MRAQMDVASPRSLGRWIWWQDCSQAGLKSSSQSNGAAFHLQPGPCLASRLQVCFLKEAILSLKLHHEFEISCLGQKFYKILFLHDGCQIIVFMGKCKLGISYSIILLTLFPRYNFLFLSRLILLVLRLKIRFKIKLT